MSKVCKKCNAIVDDDSRFCVQCGSTELAANEAHQQYYAPAPKKKSNKKLIGIISVAVAVVLAVVLLIVFLGGESDEDAGAKTLEEAIEIMEETMNGDFDRLRGIMPAEVWTWYEEKENCEFTQFKEQIAENHSEMIRDIYGDDFEASIKILGKKKISNNILKELAEIIEDKYAIPAENVEEAYDVELKYIYGGSKWEGGDEEDGCVIKINGSWYCCSYTQYNDGEYGVFFQFR